MARKKNTRTESIREFNAGVRGEDRKRELAKGGQQALIWRSAGIKGGRTTDRRKQSNKRACRSRVRLMEKPE
jgi:hypothetical protein